MPGIVATSLVVVAAWAYLIHSGSISTIWPMFGVSNQLLAAIAFGVGTTLIIKSGKAKYAWTTGIPMAFMFVTTLSASWSLVAIFRDKASKAATASEAMTFRVDAFLVFLMAALAVIVLLDMLYTWYVFFSSVRKEPAGQEL